MRPLTTNQLRLSPSQRESLGPYLHEISRYRPLSRPEEQAALLGAQAGQAAARDQLVRHNQGFILALALHYQTQEGTLTLGDLIQAGNVGLLEAVKGYAAEKDTKFITYAVWWIRKHMIEELGLAESLVSRPRHHYYQLAQAQQYVAAVQQRTGEEPGPGEVVEALQARVGRRPPVRGMQLPPCEVLSLDAPHPGGDEELGQDWHERIGAPVGDESARLATLLACTQGVLAGLPEMQARVLVLCFGLNGELAHGNEAAALVLKVSMAVHKQTLAAALRGCRRGLAAALGCAEADVLAELLAD